MQHKVDLLIFIIIFFGIMFVVFVIVAIIKKLTKYWLFAVLSLLMSIGTGYYTVFYILYKGFSKTIEVAKSVGEYILPTFNSEIPDTESNLKNFQRFFNIGITPDLKNILCSNEYGNKEAYYMFAFSCNADTAENIISTNELQKDSIKGNEMKNLQKDYKWWDKEALEVLPKYYFTSKTTEENEDEIQKEFWYDEVKGKAYYFEKTRYRETKVQQP